MLLFAWLGAAVSSLVSRSSTWRQQQQQQQQQQQLRGRLGENPLRLSSAARVLLFAWLGAAVSSLLCLSFVDVVNLSLVSLRGGAVSWGCPSGSSLASRMSRTVGWFGRAGSLAALRGAL